MLIAAAPSRFPGARRRRLGWTLGAVFVASRVLLLVEMYLTRGNAQAYPADAGDRYFEVAGSWAAGRWPYRDFAYEYPPATLPLIRFAWVAGGHARTGFVLAWVAMMVALDVVVYAVLRRWRPDDPRPALAWIAGIAAFGTSVYLRNDLLVVACVLLAVRAVAADRPTAAGLALGGGVIAKLWPAAPLVAVAVLWPGRRRRLVAGASGVVGTTLLLAAALGCLGPMIRSLRATQGNRPLEIESLWALPTLVGDARNGRHVPAGFSFGSYNVAAAAPGLPTAAYVVSSSVVLALVAVPVGLRLAGRGGAGVRGIAWLLLAYATTQLLVAPVFSAQYLLWPLGAACAVLCTERSRRSAACAALLVLGCAATQVVYPFLFDRLLVEDRPAVATLAVRDALVLAAAVLAILGATRALTGERDPHSGPGRPLPSYT